MKRVTSGPAYGRFILATVLFLLTYAMNSRVAVAADQWLPIPNDGLNGPVYAIASIGNDVYVGGNFTATKDGSIQDLNGIALYRNGVWSPLPRRGLYGGVTTLVNSLAVIGNDLYVGGVFKETVDGAVTGLNGIARFSDGEWFPLANNGLNGDVYALEVRGKDLYVGGFFNTTGDGFIDGLSSIAEYHDGAWSSLPNRGLNGAVKALKWFRGELYAGGDFDETRDRTVEDLSNIAKLENGKVWKRVGRGFDRRVNALEVFNNRLIIGGDFTSSGDGVIRNLGYIVSSDGARYEPFANNGLNYNVFALFAQDGVLYVGGAFRDTADDKVKKLNMIAKFSNDKWSAMPSRGLTQPVRAFAAAGGSLFVGGNFWETDDGAVRDIWHFAEFNLGANIRLTQTVRFGSFATEFVASLQVVNRGPNLAHKLRVSDAVPDKYIATNVTTDKGTCEFDEANVLCTVDDLGNGSAMNINLTLKAKGSVPFVVKNCAQAKSETYDPNPVNDKACARVPPQ